MVPAEIPAAVRRFIVDHIISVEQLEILLLLHHQPDRWWSVGEVNTEVRTSLTSANDRLGDLAARRLVAVEEGAERRYRFAPANERLRSLVRLVAETYRGQRVAIITLIYSKPPDALRDLADAFRIGKGKGDG